VGIIREGKEFKMATEKLCYYCGRTVKVRSRKTKTCPKCHHNMRKHGPLSKIGRW